MFGFLVAIVIAGVLLAHSAGAGEVADSVATRLVGDRGRDLVDLAERTVRSVARGIIGTALIQSTLVGLGLFAAGIPGAAFLTLICFLLCVVQIGPALVLIGAAVWMFSHAGTLTFVLFIGWASSPASATISCALPDQPGRRRAVGGDLLSAIGRRSAGARPDRPVRRPDRVRAGLPPVPGLGPPAIGRSESAVERDRADEQADQAVRS